MRSHRALGGLIFSGAVLLPFAIFADSQLASGTHGPLTATAHLRFRIVIPTVLSLDVAGATRTAGAQTVTVTSNSRNVALGATLGNSAEVTGLIVLSAAAGRVIAKDAPCAAQPGQRTLCTVSMP
jgi:hypothetical protein